MFALFSFVLCAFVALLARKLRHRSARVWGFGTLSILFLGNAFNSVFVGGSELVWLAVCVASSLILLFALPMSSQGTVRSANEEKAQAITQSASSSTPPTVKPNRSVGNEWAAAKPWQRNFLVVMFLLGAGGWAFDKFKPQPSAAVGQTSDSAKPTLSVEQCESDKAAAFRREQGEAPLITNDMLTEWHEQCSASRGDVNVGTVGSQRANPSLSGSWSCDYGSVVANASGSIVKFDSAMERSVGLDKIDLTIDGVGSVRATHSDGSGFQGTLQGSTISAPKRSFEISWNSNGTFYALTPRTTVVREGSVHSMSLLCKKG